MSVCVCVFVCVNVYVRACVRVCVCVCVCYNVYEYANCPVLREYPFFLLYCITPFLVTSNSHGVPVAVRQTMSNATRGHFCRGRHSLVSNQANIQDNVKRDLLASLTHN